MNAIELLDIINDKETSTVQFKREITHNDAMAAEIVAMANSLGGMILLGVADKTGEIVGVDLNSKINERLANIATHNVKPPIYIQTEMVTIEKEAPVKILVVHIPHNPKQIYKDNYGAIWVKQGSDKRRVTDDFEILRLYQKSGNLLADEMEVYDTSIDDVNKWRFDEYFKKEFGQTYEEKGLTYEEALKAKRVLRNAQLTLAGLLFFGKDPQSIKPAFTIKAVSYFGNSIESNDYRSKPVDLKGSIPELFDGAIKFLKLSLHYLQAGQGFNSIGKLEVSEIALIELVQNALVHRDYFKNSPIRLLIFDNRIEIISPGKLPNSLTVEDIKFGNPVIRNNQLVAFSTHTLPFSGLGSGIKRALAEQPNIELINDTEGEQFKVIIPRPEKK
jgi:predicted HTH transcriptional regulator